MIGSLIKLIALLMILLLVGSTFVGGIIYFIKWLIMEFFKELWHNQPNTVIGASVAICVLLGIYIWLLNTYK